MSRTLSKILVLCAVIAIFPLMIVGTAFAAYHSFESTISIGFYFVNGEKAEGTNAKAAVRYDGIDKFEDFKISKGHLDKANLDIPTPVGYDFVGWYKGNKVDYEADKAPEILSPKTLSVDMTNGTEYLAIFEVYKYKVNYRYTENPNVSPNNNAAKVPESDEKYAGQDFGEYNYGATLPVLKDVQGWKFIGWRKYVENEVDTTGTPYVVAEFGDVTKENGDRVVTLSSDWKANPQVIVTYYDYTTKSQIVKESVDRDTTNQYNYSNQFNNLVKEEKKEPDLGYVWEGFVNADGSNLPTVSDFTSLESTPTKPAEVKVYVTKGAVKYTANIAVEEKASASYTGTKIEFTVNDIAENYKNLFKGVFEENSYNKKYSFFTFKDVKVNNEVISSVDGLATELSKLINENKHESAELTLIAEFNTEFNVQVTQANGVKYIVSKSGGILDESNHVYVPDEGSRSALDPTTIQSMSTTVTLKEFLGLTNYTVFYDAVSDGNEVVFSKLYIDGISLTVDNITLESTMNDVLQLCCSQGKGTVAPVGTTFTLEVFQVIFEQQNI